MNDENTPPCDLESEQMVLGCMLNHIDNLNLCADILDPEDFYSTEHQVIFRILKNAYKEDHVADVHLVCQELKRIKYLEEVGGIPYVMGLAQTAGLAVYPQEYAEAVRKKSILRQMMYASQRIHREALSNPKDPQEVLDEAQNIFFRISQASPQRAGYTLRNMIDGKEIEGSVPISQTLEKRRETYQNRNPNAPTITGIPTHFVDLDKIINGLGKSHLIIVAGRTSMGKTMLAVNIAENVCFKEHLSVGIFSLEMTADEILYRMISSQAQVDSEKIRTGNLTDEEMERVHQTLEVMKQETMIIDDQSGLKINDLRTRARRMKEKHNIQLLIIDYLQFIQPSHKNAQNRHTEIAEISRILKSLAKELHIPVICTAQLSRKADERTNHKPMMSDLRESGAIEQDADLILLLFRREYYDPNDKPGVAEVFVSKNRHGPVGQFPLTFVKKFVQFKNAAPLEASAQEDPYKDI